jgi:hypothetical protein
VTSYVNCIQKFCVYDPELCRLVSNLASSYSIPIVESCLSTIDGVPDITSFIDAFDSSNSFENGLGYQLTKRLIASVNPFDKIGLIRQNLDLSIKTEIELVQRNRENKLMLSHKKKIVQDIPGIEIPAKLKKKKKKKVSYHALMDAVIRTSENGHQTPADAALLDEAAKIISAQVKEKNRGYRHPKASARSSNLQSTVLIAKRRTEEADPVAQHHTLSSSVILMEDSKGEMHIAEDFSGSVRRRPAVYIASSSRASTSNNPVGVETNIEVVQPVPIQEPLQTNQVARSESISLPISEMVDMDIEFLQVACQRYDTASISRRTPKPPSNPPNSKALSRKRVSFRRPQHHRHHT